MPIYHHDNISLVPLRVLTRPRNVRTEDNLAPDDFYSIPIYMVAFLNLHGTFLNNEYAIFARDNARQDYK